MNHTELLNYLAAKHNLKTYLEIGVRTTQQNFDKIICDYKVGVDPAVKDTPNVFCGTSDKWFSILKYQAVKTYDLIFIDGLHHADQVKKDFENSLQFLNDNGFILIHDCLPEDEVTTCVPRWNQKIWHGDVYKFTMNLQSYNGIDFITYNFDNGCCLVWKDANKVSAVSAENITWEYYKQHRQTNMHIQEWQKELI